MWAIKHIGVVSRSTDKNSIATGLVAEVVHRAGARDANLSFVQNNPLKYGHHPRARIAWLFIMDMVLNFVFDFRTGGQKEDAPQVPEGFVLRLATSSDIESFVEIVRASFAGHFGRFHADPGLAAPLRRGFTRNGFGRARMAGRIGFSSRCRAIAWPDIPSGKNLPLLTGTMVFGLVISASQLCILIFSDAEFSAL
jgi:hypothetical protein